MGGGLVLILAWRTNPWAVLEALRLISWETAALSLAIFLLASLLLGGSLLVFVPDPFNLRRIRQVLIAHLGGVLLSDVTPARSGYFLTPLLLERLAGVPKDAGLASLAGMQAVSLVTKAGLAASAVPLLAGKMQEVAIVADITKYTFLSGTVLFLLGVGFGVAVWTPALEGFIRLIDEKVPYPPLRPFLQRLVTFLSLVRAGGRIRYQKLLVGVAFAALSTITAGLGLLPIADAVGLEGLTVVDIIMIGAVAGPLVYLPIAPAGLGVMETAYVLLLGALGQSASSALAFALAARVLFTGVDLVGLPAVVWGLGWTDTR
jgi:uncharacterized membrane protein YbhN (UPF0104 family)